LNILPTFEQLTKLDLCVKKLEGIEGGDSEMAQCIMTNLHFLKLGVPFDLISIHLGYEIGSWVPEIMSRLNVHGDYEQWEEGMRQSERDDVESNFS